MEAEEATEATEAIAETTYMEMVIYLMRRSILQKIL